MCTRPAGHAGTFFLLTTRPSDTRFKEGGIRIPVEVRDGRIDTTIEGPPNTFVAGQPPLKLPIAIGLDRDAMRARLTIGAVTADLAPGQLSGWLTLTFRAAPGVHVSGLTRVQILEMGGHFSLYMSPLNLDPERPAMPISSPSYYATYLAKRIGTYATLGLAEDTWALNEGVTSEVLPPADLRCRWRAACDVLRRPRSTPPRIAGVRVRCD